VVPAPDAPPPFWFMTGPGEEGSDSASGGGVLGDRSGGPEDATLAPLLRPLPPGAKMMCTVVRHNSTLQVRGLSLSKNTICH
jgi:hypothetical protein